MSTSKIDKLRQAKWDAEAEMALARAALSDAQRAFAAAKKKHRNAVEAYVAECEK